MKKIILLAALLLAQPTYALSPTKALIAKRAQVCAMFVAMGFSCRPMRIKW